MQNTSLISAALALLSLAACSSDTNPGDGEKQEDLPGAGSRKRRLIIRYLGETGTSSYSLNMVFRLIDSGARKPAVGQQAGYTLPFFQHRLAVTNNEGVADPRENHRIPLAS